MIATNRVSRNTSTHTTPPPLSSFISSLNVRAISVKQETRHGDKNAFTFRLYCPIIISPVEKSFLELVIKFGNVSREIVRKLEFGSEAALRQCKVVTEFLFYTLRN